MSISEEMHAKGTRHRGARLYSLAIFGKLCAQLHGLAEAEDGGQQLISGL